MMQKLNEKGPDQITKNGNYHEKIILATNSIKLELEELLNSDHPVSKPLLNWILEDQTGENRIWYERVRRDDTFGLVKYNGEYVIQWLGDFIELEDLSGIYKLDEVKYLVENGIHIANIEKYVNLAGLPGDLKDKINFLNKILKIKINQDNTSTGFAYYWNSISAPFGDGIGFTVIGPNNINGNNYISSKDKHCGINIRKLIN